MIILVRGHFLLSSSSSSDSSPLAPEFPPDSVSPSPSGRTWRESPPSSSADSASFAAELTARECEWMPEWHAVCYAAASGKGSGEIASELGYTQAWVSTVLHKPEVQERIERIRRADHEKFSRRLAEAAPRVLDYYLDVAFGIEKGDPHRLRASEWVMEKHDGKAVQKVAGDGGNTALELIRALKDLRVAANQQPPAPKTDSAIDVTPGPALPLAVEAAAETDQLDDWITANIKDEG